MLASKTIKRKNLKPRRKTQPKQNNVTAIKDDRLFVCPLGETHRFIFQNQSCSHSSSVVLNQGTVSASTDTTGSLSMAPDLDTTCVALKAFGMSFFRPLGMIFCQIHKVCVPLSLLKSHITTAISWRHTGILVGPFGKNLIEPFLSHVASAFHLPLDQNRSDSPPSSLHPQLSSSTLPQYLLYYLPLDLSKFPNSADTIKHERGGGRDCLSSET